MARGEFESQKELEKYLPDNDALALAYGRLELDCSSSFFLATFRHLSDEILDPQRLAEVLKRLHQTSVSPTGQFGFHVTTYDDEDDYDYDYDDDDYYKVSLPLQRTLPLYPRTQQSEARGESTSW